MEKLRQDLKNVKSEIKALKKTPQNIQQLKQAYKLKTKIENDINTKKMERTLKRI